VKKKIQQRGTRAIAEFEQEARQVWDSRELLPDETINNIVLSFNKSCAKAWPAAVK
jgi:hypothetical protein